MVNNEINTYRFSSGHEPSDELLNLLMKEVAEDAMVRRAKARRDVHRRVQIERRELHKRWHIRIQEVIK